MKPEPYAMTNITKIIHRFDPLMEIKATSLKRDESLVDYLDNGFIGTILLAYSKHLPLMLNPNHIWLAVCQGVAAHFIKTE